MAPTTGRIVHYTLSEFDAAQVNKRRSDATAHIPEHRDNANGVVVHSGNPVHAGDVYPMIITRVWGADEFSSVNGQVLLDGNDTIWVTSVSLQRETEPAERHFVWPPHA